MGVGVITSFFITVSQSLSGIRVLSRLSRCFRLRAESGKREEKRERESDKERERKGERGSRQGERRGWEARGAGGKGCGERY